MSTEFRNFHDARKFVHELGLKTQKEWLNYCKSGNRPKDIPANPSRIYKNQGWKDTGDWLGTGTIAYRKRNYRSFKEAKNKVRELAKEHGLKNSNDWSEFVKSGNKPDNIPANPGSYYKKKKSGDNQA